MNVKVVLPRPKDEPCLLAAAGPRPGPPPPRRGVRPAQPPAGGGLSPRPGPDRGGRHQRGRLHHRGGQRGEVPEVIITKPSVMLQLLQPPQEILFLGLGSASGSSQNKNADTDSLARSAFKKHL